MAARQAYNARHPSMHQLHVVIIAIQITCGVVFWMQPM
jgi:hypothetical protein